MPVQPGAQRQLRGRKAQKVPARKQAQVAGLQRKLLRQCGRQRGRNRPHQRRQEVGEGKGQKNDDRCPPGQHRMPGHWSTIPAKNWSANSGRGLPV